MTHKYLYDNEELFYPISEASAINSGVVVQGNTVWLDLEQIWTKAQSAYNNSIGATQVQGSLGIVVEYSANNANNPKDAAEATYSATLVLPTAEAPYLWQKTIYKWKDIEVKTTYTIVATALFPETQLMFAVGELDDEVGVPTEYIDGAADTTNEDIKWYTYPPQDISNTKPCAFIATRHRDANETWEGKVWKSAKYGQYPVTT